MVSFHFTCRFLRAEKLNRWEWRWTFLLPLSPQSSLQCESYNVAKMYRVRWLNKINWFVPASRSFNTETNIFSGLATAVCRRCGQRIACVMPVPCRRCHIVFTVHHDARVRVKTAHITDDCVTIYRFVQRHAYASQWMQLFAQFMPKCWSYKRICAARLHNVRKLNYTLRTASMKRVVFSDESTRYERIRFTTKLYSHCNHSKLTHECVFFVKWEANASRRRSKNKLEQMPGAHATEWQTMIDDHKLTAQKLLLRMRRDEKRSATITQKCPKMFS